MRGNFTTLIRVLRASFRLLTLVAYYHFLYDFFCMEYTSADHFSSTMLILQDETAMFISLSSISKNHL